MTPTTDTPRTDAVMASSNWPYHITSEMQKLERELNELWSRFDKQMDAEAEVERLTQRMKEAEDLIKGLHDGWKKARKAHLETCKNAQAEIDKLHTENVCLQELIQEFYEWSRRDFPTEQEVREIMNRYHDLLNK
jgi:predicted  nucleic acid-binding Zn-ribbon protein